MKRYYPLRKGKIQESINKMIQITCNLLSKQLGDHVYPSPMEDLVKKGDEGLTYGIIATVGSSRMLRFNFQGSSSQIRSVDIWKELSLQPDLTVETEGMSVVKVIPAIVAAFETGQPQTMILEEDLAMPKGGGALSKAIADSINQWASAMKVDNTRLEKTRIKDLYNDYLYWYHEMSDKSTKLVTDPSFRNYIVRYLEDNHLTNIFMRSVKIKPASGEVIVQEKGEQDEFNAMFYNMSLSDKMEFLKSSILAVVRGYDNSLIISGMAGVGKSKTVRDILEEEGAHAKWIQGSVKNYEVLYKFFYDNNGSHSIIVIDDTDEVFSKKYLSLMNAVMAPEAKRLVSYPTDFSHKLPKGYKEEFWFEGRIIIITNLPKRRIPNSLISRGAMVEIQTTTGDVIDYLRTNLHNVMTEYPDATMDVKIEVLDFIEQIKKHISHIDFRLFKRACIYKLSGNPNWKKFTLVILKTYAK